VVGTGYSDKDRYSGRAVRWVSQGEVKSASMSPIHMRAPNMASWGSTPRSIRNAC